MKKASASLSARWNESATLADSSRQTGLRAESPWLRSTMLSVLPQANLRQICEHPTWCATNKVCQVRYS